MVNGIRATQFSSMSKSHAGCNSSFDVSLIKCSCFKSVRQLSASTGIAQYGRIVATEIPLRNSLAIVNRAVAAEDTVLIRGRVFHRVDSIGDLSFEGGRFRIRASLAGSPSPSARKKLTLFSRFECCLVLCFKRQNTMMPVNFAVPERRAEIRFESRMRWPGIAQEAFSRSSRLESLIVTSLVEKSGHDDLSRYSKW
jgi:hypothetical protein